MADLTLGAVSNLVGHLGTVIDDERKLLKGVKGDMQFIKDEMESMNGFLLHLTKTEGTHDDQVRAWMKQVRDIAYLAQDYIALYSRDFAGTADKGLWASLRYYLVDPIWKCSARSSLASKISDLKVRVNDVGVRRQRYDISIPQVTTAPQRLADSQAKQEKIEELRDVFERALARDKEKQPEAPPFDEAIGLLASKDLRSAATTARAALYKRLQGDHGAIARTRRICVETLGRALGRQDRRTSQTSWKEPEVVCMEVVLRALYADRQDRRTAQTKEKIVRLVKAADTNLPSQLMIFCYSMLSRCYKSCLQYLYAFHDEISISRTSLVRRWLAEGLVEKQGDHTLEEAAELCFKDLLFRGFLLPHDQGAAGKVKSCKIDNTVWEFLHTMSTTENFVSDLPFHLHNQLRIRGFVKQQLKENPRPREVVCGFRRSTRPTGPMDEMVKFLKSLPRHYRLNVLDLGGCRGLEKSHLKRICKVQWLKYLSLRNTGVSWLPEQINSLRLLETLDIRQTELRQKDTEEIYLPNLKHLLTCSCSQKMNKEKVPLYASIPRKIASMTKMEILSRVQVQHGRDAAKRELEQVGRLPDLRKLGVVLGGSQAKENVSSLLHAITMLSECLRSLSVWITPLPNSPVPTMEMNQQHNAPKLLRSLDISGLGTTGLPDWILHLEQLSEITLCESHLSKEYLHELGKNLHHLRCLRLRRNSYSEPKLAFNKDGFQDLRFLVIEGETIDTLDFEEEGAAPKLKKIVWCNVPIKHAGTLCGVHRLRSLEEVVLKGHFPNFTSIQAKAPGVKVRYG